MLPILATQGVQYGLLALGFLIIMVGIVYAAQKRVVHETKRKVR
jgi:hypothetical protein